MSSLRKTTRLYQTLGCVQITPLKRLQLPVSESCTCPEYKTMDACTITILFQQFSRKAGSGAATMPMPAPLPLKSQAPAAHFRERLPSVVHTSTANQNRKAAVTTAQTVYHARRLTLRQFTPLPGEPGLGWPVRARCHACMPHTQAAQCQERKTQIYCEIVPSVCFAWPPAVI